MTMSPMISNASGGNVKNGTSAVCDKERVSIYESNVLHHKEGSNLIGTKTQSLLHRLKI